MALLDKLVCPFHANELREEYDTGGAWDGEVFAVLDQTTLKNNAKTNIKAAIDTFVAGIPYADGAAQAAAVVTLKAAVDTAVNTFSTTVNQPIKNVLDTVYENYVTLVEGVNAFNCPECAGLGKMPIYEADGSDSGEERASPLCDGLGKTLIQYKRNPNGAGFIPA